ncbi:dehydratase [Pandoraea vervacti]|uniref:Dehydratase n=1 Tax=Pandoraea vervacti TaxID=656178 RepID=A0ABN4FQ87_9BURK|nr:MaoC family dehydratase [Pandoraea vervacti]AJP56807.1 dehydratase [Pandoraea vervacti]
MAKHFNSAEALLCAAGSSLGTTEWLEIDQARVNQFADATGDHQWIHVDAERASAGPFGACIAHGYLTLALAGSYFLSRLIDVRMRMGVNYGCEKIRFPAPVPVGRRVRAHGEIVSVAPVDGGGVHAVIRVTVEIEGGERPACVADTVSRYYF